MTATSAQSAYNANPFTDLPAIRGPDTRLSSAHPKARRFPSPRFGDYSRTRFESRVAFGGPDESEDAEEIQAPTRQFSLLEITSGLPDDSQEADERAAERRLRELRGRVKAARAIVSRIPGLAETLARDWQKAARFYARFRITEAMFRHGVAECPIDAAENSLYNASSILATAEESRGRSAALLPGDGRSQLRGSSVSY